MMQALDCHYGELAQMVCRDAFEQGLIIENSGAQGQVVKCMPPLTIADGDLKAGVDILNACMHAVFDRGAIVSG